MEVELYREVVERIRRHDRELIRTSRPAFIPSEDDPEGLRPRHFAAAPRAARGAHRADQADVCSLDLNTMNSGPDVVMNTPEETVRCMAG